MNHRRHGARSLCAIVAVAAACRGPAARSVEAERAPHGRAAATVAVDTAAGRQLAWLLDKLAHGGAAERPELITHFDRSFLERRPPDALRPALAALAGHLGSAMFGAVTSSDAEHVVAHGVAPGGRFAIVLAVSPATHQIVALDVQADAGPRPTSIADAIRGLGALAPRSQLLVSELVGGACKPLYGSNAAEPLAIASVFKLYVLLGLTDRVLAGRAAWDDELVVRTDWLSLPVDRDNPPGTRLSLRALAERMISISDNTAADHLLYTVGRREVEAAVRASGHAAPALDTPFLATRELFWLKTAVPASEVAAYLALEPESKRRFLDGLAGRHPVTDFSDWTLPRDIERIEWFASAEDLCRLAAALWSRAQSPRGAAVFEVLAKNPGLSDTAPWSYVGFKGGSEPGVTSATWLLHRRDGRWFVVSVGANAPAAIDEGTFRGIADGVLDVVARDGR